MTEEVKKKKCLSTMTRVVLWSVGSPFILMVWWVIASTIFQQYKGISSCVDSTKQIEHIKDFHND